MLSTNKLLLFVAILILLGLLFGFEFGLILIATAVICFSSYEPFNSNSYKIKNDDDDDEFDIEQEEEQDSVASEQTHELDDEDEYQIEKKNTKMSLWKSRSSTPGARVKISRPESTTSFPVKRSSLSSPRITPRQPLGNLTRSVQQTSRGDQFRNDNRENSSLLSNLNSPLNPVRHKDLDTSSQSSSLLSSPFLPRVKRAIGIGEANLPQKSNSPHRNSYGMSSGRLFSPQTKALPYPSASSPGWMPLVRLNRHEKPTLTENNSNMVHSPVTVKIAPPSSHRLNSSRVSISREESIESTRKAPDKSTVLTALREKSFSRKRSIANQDEAVTDVLDQMSKRRKQDDSTSSSSMASEPEFLAELTQNGYSNIPLHMVGLKRPATPTLDMETLDPSERYSKKSKTDNRNNSILSSLSSSRRGIAKEMSEFHLGEKRKPEEDCWDAEREQHSKISKTDNTIIDPTHLVSSTPVPENRPKPMIPDTDLSKRVVKETGTQSDLPIEQEQIKPQQSLKKKLLFDAEKSGMKVKKGIYSSLNSPATKAATFDVTATAEDYDEDREAERQRAIDMLRDIETHEGAFQKEKDKTQIVMQVPYSNASLILDSLQKSAPTTSSDSGTRSALSELLKSGTDDNKTVSSNPSSGFLSALAAAADPTNTVAATGLTSSASTATNSDAPPQYSFKPVFPTTLTSTATTTLTSTPGPLSGGFSLPQTQSQTVAPTSSTSANASVTTQPSTTPGTFSFGTVTQAAPQLAVNGTTSVASTAPVLSLTSLPQSAAPPASSTVTFSFNSQPSQATTFPAQLSSTSGLGSTSAVLSKPTAATTPFTFGQVSSTSTPQTSGVTNSASVISQSTDGFSFGGTTTSSTTNPAGGFSFGAAQSTTAGSSQQTATTPASGFSFGAAPSTTAGSFQQTATAPASGFSFGAAPSAKPAAQPPGSLTFGGAQSFSANTSQAPSFGLSAVTSSASQPAAAANTFNFSSSASGASTPALSFGSGQIGNTSQGTVFGVTSAPALSSQGSMFGSTTAPATTQGSIFGTAQSSNASAQGSMFKSTESPAQTQGSMFGSTQPATQISLFGGQASATTASSTFGSSANGFNFSAGSTPSFGQTTTASSGFGSSVASSSSTPFQFGGSNNNTSAAPAFGSNGSGFSFGTGSSNPGSGSAFGSSNSGSGSAFGSSNSGSGSAFGSKPASNATVPNFLAAQTAQPTTFGQSSGSAFGSFGSKPATGVFGSSQAPAPAPVFGQNSSSAFGTPASGNQGTFAFGQSSNPPPSTPVKGFDFSSSAGVGTPSLQFGSSDNQMSGFSTPTPQTPVMNFGSGTPGGGFGTPTGGMFSVGSGATAPRPRSRARRKGTKR